MDETIRAAKIDERSEITNAGDTAFADGSLLQFRQQGLSLLDAHVLGCGTFRKDGALSAAVDFNDLELELMADEGIEGLELVIALALGEFTMLG